MKAKQNSKKLNKKNKSQIPCSNNKINNIFKNMKIYNYNILKVKKLTLNFKRIYQSSNKNSKNQKSKMINTFKIIRT